MSYLNNNKELVIVALICLLFLYIPDLIYRVSRYPRLKWLAKKYNLSYSFGDFPKIWGMPSYKRNFITGSVNKNRILFYDLYYPTGAYKGRRYKIDTILYINDRLYSFSGDIKRTEKVPIKRIRQKFDELQK